MISISIDANLKSTIDKLTAVSVAQWPLILSNAANETAYYVLNKIRQQMPSFIDRPTPYTLNSMFVDKATPAKLEASVQWKDRQRSAGQYLKPEVFGGDRKLKGFETALISARLMPQGYHAVPSKDAPLDAYGNVQRGLYNRILSALRSNPDAVLTKKRRSTKSRAQYVVIMPNSGRNLVPGIYQRSGRGLLRLFAYVSRTTYREQFPFYDIGAQAAQAKFPDKLAAALDQALK